MYKKFFEDTLLYMGSGGPRKDGESKEGAVFMCIL